MYTANQSVLLAFSQTIDRIAGRTDLQITAGEAGFGEDVLEKVQASATVRVAVPIIEAVVDPDLQGEGDLLVLGVDMTGDRSLRDHDLDSGDEGVVDDPLIFLAQPDSLIVSNELADRNGLRVGSHLPLQTADGEKAFVVRGIMRASGLASAFGGNIAIMDVYAAQHMFGRGRTFDRIDLALAPGTPLAQAEEELTRLSRLRIRRPAASRTRTAGRSDGRGLHDDGEHLQRVRTLHRYVHHLQLVRHVGHRTPRRDRDPARSRRHPGPGPRPVSRRKHGPRPGRLARRPRGWRAHREGYRIGDQHAGW